MFLGLRQEVVCKELLYVKRSLPRRSGMVAVGSPLQVLVEREFEQFQIPQRGKRYLWRYRIG
jgi:hypothetical protein